MFICLVFSLAQFLPSYQRWRAGRWESWLSAQLGIRVELASLENQSPTSWKLHGVRLQHPETGATLGRVPCIDVASRDGRWTIFLHEPELERRQLNATWKMVHDWFLCRPQRYSQAAAVGADRLTIRGSLESEEFSDIVLRMQPNEHELMLDIKFQMIQANEGTTKLAQDSPPSSLKIRRQHTENRLMTELRLQTSTALPCQLFHGLLPSTTNLGEAASFTGTLDWQMSDYDWQLMLSEVELQQVDFGNLGRWLGNKVSGHGMIYINHASLTNQHLQSATASIIMKGPGSISSDLLSAASDYLDVDVRQTNSVENYGFDYASFTINIEPQQLRLAGRLPGDALLSDSVGPLAQRSVDAWDRWVPLDNVVDLLHKCDRDTSSRLRSTSRSLSPIARTAQRWLPLGAPSSHMLEEVSLR